MRPKPVHKLFYVVSCVAVTVSIYLLFLLFGKFDDSRLPATVLMRPKVKWAFRLCTRSIYTSLELFVMLALMDSETMARVCAVCVCKINESLTLGLFKIHKCAEIRHKAARRRRYSRFPAESIKREIMLLTPHRQRLVISFQSAWLRLLLCRSIFRCFCFLLFHFSVFLLLAVLLFNLAFFFSVFKASVRGKFGQKGKCCWFFFHSFRSHCISYLIGVFIFFNFVRFFFSYLLSLVWPFIAFISDSNAF